MLSAITITDKHYFIPCAISGFDIPVCRYFQPVSCALSKRLCEHLAKHRGRDCDPLIAQQLH